MRWTRVLPVACAAIALLACLASTQPDDPVTNGSFERLAPNGFPVDWEPVGAEVGVTGGAHSGRTALRIRRGADAGPETGLNRAWRAHSGQQAAMLSQLKGGIVFWYRAERSGNARLVFHVIPMSDKPLEDTGEPRAAYDIPPAHVGDGQWHEGRLKYDFTAVEKARWVQISPRITGGPGELLLDDIGYVPSVGPWLSLDDVEIVESQREPGERCTIRATVRNRGDQPAQGLRARIEAPPRLRVLGDAAPPVQTLAVDSTCLVGFDLDGRRDEPGAVTVHVSHGDGQELAARLPFGPELSVIAFVPERFILAPGEHTRIDLVLENTGHAFVRGLHAYLEPVDQVAVLGAPQRRTDDLAPGRRTVLRWRLGAVAETPGADVGVVVRTDNAGRGRSSIPIIVAGQKGDARDLAASGPTDPAQRSRGFVSLRFPRAAAWLGLGELWAARGKQSPRLVARLPHLFRVVYRTDRGDVRDVRLGYQDLVSTDPSPAGPNTSLTATSRDEDGAVCELNATFRSGPSDPVIPFEYELLASRDLRLLRFEGPMLYAGEGSFGAAKTEAVLPGLEWLVDDEFSSSTIDDRTPAHLRRVPHPNKITWGDIGILHDGLYVGLHWDPYHRWDGEHDRMSAMFASPAHFQSRNCHLLGLFVPSVPEWVGENETLATTPYLLEAGRKLTIAGAIVVRTGGNDGAFRPTRLHQPVRLPDPLPLPHADDLPGEIAWNVEAYLNPDILWDPDGKQWWTSKGAGPLLSSKGRSPQFIKDLLLASQVIPDQALARACRQRAEEVLAEMGGRSGELALSYLVGSPDDALLGYAGQVANLVLSQRPDGSWRFDADQVPGPVFKGMDYHQLGPDDAVEVGTCARRAYEVLRLARMTGDERAGAAGLKALKCMQRFTVPRAAQVWEVPVHTPDILAAADAIDAYMEGYWLTGDDRWLREAVTWGWRGLPFVYLWNTDEFPFMRYASIPVFGASWHRASWFGRPVQWNGLRYAGAALKLARHDDSLDWRRLAEGLMVSAMYQQATEGDNKALWPDSISAIDGGKSGWVFAPYQINEIAYELQGRLAEPAVTAVAADGGTLRIAAVARVRAADVVRGRLRATLTYPAGETSYVTIAGIDRPRDVVVNGSVVRPLDEVGESQPACRYDPARALLAIRVPHTGRDLVEVSPARHRPADLLPVLARRIDFDFPGRSSSGFLPAHDVELRSGGESATLLRITGPDPYIVRPAISVAGDSVKAVLVRLRVHAGQHGQFYWTTKASPAFAEDKAIVFPLQADGRWHTYELPVRDHSLWRGHEITAVRLDPTNGAAAMGTQAEVDFIRGTR